MTKRELIQEYAAGRIDRRDFIARLTGLGVSGAAALAYAQGIAPSASAAALGRDRNGYIVHQTAGEYGPGGIFNSIVELLTFAIKFFQAVLDLIAALLKNLLASAPTRGVRALAPITVGDALPNGDTVTQNDIDQLNTLHNQLNEQFAAIKAAYADFGGKDSGSVAPKSTPTATDDLTTLADMLNKLVGFQAAVIPTVSGDGPKTSALRTTLVTSALVEAQHAAFVNQLVGDPPFPDTFAKALSGADIDALIAQLG